MISISREEIIWFLYFILLFFQLVVAPEMNQRLRQQRLELEESMEIMKKQTEEIGKTAKNLSEAIKKYEETKNKSDVYKLFEIIDSHEIYRCSEIKDETFQILCAMEIVNETQDYTKCWQINESTITYENKLRDWCFYYSALAEFKNKSLCDYISNSSLRYECFLKRI